MSLKVTILGCGSAFGVPLVGKNWGDCNPQNPKNRRTRSSILIEKNNTRLLVDMSPDYNIQSERHSLGYFDSVIFTHAHADHIGGCMYLPIIIALYYNGPLPCYAAKETLQGIKKHWWYQHDPQIAPNLYDEGCMPEWELFEYNRKLLIKDMKVLPFEQIHGDVTSTGLRIDNFAYSTDVSNFSDKSLEALEGLDTWIIGCDTLNEPRDGSHFYLDKCLEWIARIKPKKSYLTHLDFTMDYDSVTKMLPDNVYLAYDGLILDL